MADLAALKNSHLFQDLDENELGALSRVFHEMEMAEGATIFIENMPGEMLYLIREGTVRISKMLAEGQEKTLVILGPEDVFGEMAILDTAPRSATARAVEKARLLCIKKQDFEAVCDQNPRLGLKLMRNIIRVFSRRIRENNDEFRDMLIWSLGKRKA
ncbi:MAG: cyclic nucleotide-binding domain-containing protein [Deltaproteobacteria bacterium]|nr:MAG: cyclic nucleotide-binding domain-containing protein [Deltaproteobacteria bacterium]